MVLQGGTFRLESCILGERVDSIDKLMHAFKGLIYFFLLVDQPIGIEINQHQGTHSWKSEGCSIWCSSGAISMKNSEKSHRFQSLKNCRYIAIRRNWKESRDQIVCTLRGLN